jgi:Protein of unknown function (DUF3768)
MVSDEEGRTNRIRDLNDTMRNHGIGGQIMLTVGIRSLGNMAVENIVEAVRKFENFTDDNDPYKEHDYGSVMVDNNKVLWKIDYYDRDLQYGSPDPSDPAATKRILTIMLASEY